MHNAVCGMWHAANKNRTYNNRVSVIPNVRFLVRYCMWYAMQTYELQHVTMPQNQISAESTQK